MSLTRQHVLSIMEPYLKGDFEGFVRNYCTPDFTYELAPGDIASKFHVKGKQHEFAGTFIGHDAAVKMILEVSLDVKSSNFHSLVLRNWC